MHMFFGIPQRYTVDIYGFYFEEYILGYLSESTYKNVPARSKASWNQWNFIKKYHKKVEQL